MSYDAISKQFVGQQPAVEQTCWCGLRSAIPAALDAEYRRANDLSHGSMPLYCPLGHAGYPAGKSVADRLREELERANSRAANWRSNAERAQRQVAARKGQITKLKKRVAAGVCPCCARTFQNLARHMAGQHPDYAHPESDA